MSRRGQFVVTTFTNPSGSTAFRVSGTKLNGERIRLNFTTKPAALLEQRRLELDALRPGMIKITRLSDEQLRETEEAFSLLGNRSLIQAVRFYVAHHRKQMAQRLLTDALAEFLAFKERRNRRPDTVRSFRYKIGRFLQRHPGKNVSDILREHVESFVLRAGIDIVTSQNDWTALHNFFNWASSRGYCADNPAKGIELPTRDKDRSPQILSVDEVKLFFEKAATSRTGSLIPYLVLSMFAGIRPKEVSRLRWDDIDLESGLVMVRKGKTRQRRIVELSANAVAWLKPPPPFAHRSGARTGDGGSTHSRRGVGSWVRWRPSSHKPQHATN